MITGGLLRRHRGHPAVRRQAEGRLLAGVAGGLSERLGIDVTLVRVGFVLSILAGGAGVAAYVIGWLVLPEEGDQGNILSHTGSDRRGIALIAALVPALVLALVVASALDAGSLSSVIWAAFLSIAGLILVYRNARPDERARLRHAVQTYLPGQPGSVRARRMLISRITVGIVFLGLGLDLLITGHSRHPTTRALEGVVLVTGAVIAMFGPWWVRVAQDLVSERQARVRAEERADMAARVHDSVLQTLALIQRQADHPDKVAKLARAQERELRSWLFEGRPPGSSDDTTSSSLAAAVEHFARQVEEAHDVPVEVVSVGDCPLDEDLEALVGAGREATVNAAKWSRAPTIFSLLGSGGDLRVALRTRQRVGFQSPGGGFRQARSGRLDRGSYGAPRRSSHCEDLNRPGNRGSAVPTPALDATMTGLVAAQEHVGGVDVF